MDAAVDDADQGPAGNGDGVVVTADDDEVLKADLLGRVRSHPRVVHHEGGPGTASAVANHCALGASLKLIAAAASTT